MGSGPVAVSAACLVVLWALYRIARDDARRWDYVIALLCYVGLCAVAAFAVP